MAIMLGVGMFLFNLLCGLVPCDPQFSTPEVIPNPPTQITRRDGVHVNKVDMIPRVTVHQGKIEGYHMQTMGGRLIFAFEGIPYGEPPIGHLRWKPPVPRRPWRGTLQAKRNGPDCLQISLAKMLRVIGHEDCLFLNVYTPDLPSKGNGVKYPVIFYMHGGSFIQGAGHEHGPAYMLDNDVLLVTINYRLGVLGFLSTGDEIQPGNYGLKDQALALRWVYDNIAQFGGDPNDITIWGHSAGAASVHLHMLSNMTRHLFTKGVSISGSAFNHWALQTPQRARSYADKMAKWFNCPIDNSNNLVTCLRSVMPINIVAAQMQLFDWFPFPPTMFAPTIEKDSSEAFITESAEEAYKRGHVANKPWVATMTSREGQTAVLVLQLLFRLPSLKIHWDNTLPYYLDYAYIAEDVDDITRKVTRYYLGDKSPRDATNDEIGQMLSDRYFSLGIHNALQAHSQIAPTYSYWYSFSGKYSLGNYIGQTAQEWGPGHAEDDYYFFNCSTQYQGFKQSDPDYQMSKVMVNLFSNFVRTGEPLYTEDNGKTIRIWDRVTNISDIRVLQLDREVKMIQKPNVKNLHFWQNLGLRDIVTLY